MILDLIHESSFIEELFPKLAHTQAIADFSLNVIKRAHAKVTAEFSLHEHILKLFLKLAYISTNST